ncbi:integrase core domain protein [Ancylostoma duodenale]|uniref:RNA-directed DNA polymerase n=1 Tax=Ancylostoma duodenale TaxID=51022 RepID=A0A0C2GAX5_9BILA|nr:integrase core domain protein [Ancylostoma duodenale]
MAPPHDSSTFVVDLSRAEVTDLQRQQLRELFSEFADRISTSSYDLGSYDHTIITIRTTTETPPTRYRPTRIPTRFQKELDEHINKLLKSGRIVESDTPWVHNTVLVKKKDGSLRVCLDFRPLNAVTIPDRYPLPRIEDLLEKVAGHRFYTSFDLASGYMQLLLSPESQRKCGWATHRGIYQFVYLPFGLRNAGAYFCRAMSRILTGLDDNCLAYLDDIIVFDKDFDSHLLSLKKVLERFRIFNIKVSGKKLTSIAQSKITFLGHEISGTFYAPAERNIRAIREMPIPTTTKGVKSFLGMANFFRKFIQGFAATAAPLYELCKKNVAFKWGPAEEGAFAKLKEALTSRPCLVFPQDKEFVLHTDGSKVAVGAALLQQQDNSNALAAVGYFSKTLSASQQKWSPTHIELFAMISALRFFRTTIYGNRTRIFSDHKPLTFLLRHGKTHDNLARWAVELQSYDIVIEYLKGSSNVVADHLSRNTNPENQFRDDSPASDDLVEFPRCLAHHPAGPMHTCSPPHTPSGAIRIRPYDILIEQKQDPFCSTVMHLLETGAFPSNAGIDDRDHYLEFASKCVIKKNGCLYFCEPKKDPPNQHYDTIVVPSKLREAICLALHSSPTAGGHFSWKKTLAKVARRFYWPSMKEDIFKFVRSCELCQRKRPHPTNRENLIPVLCNTVFSKVYLDLSGPYHSSARSNKYIMCLIDHFTKYVITAALPDCTALTVAHSIMTECILKFGAMTELVTDNASYLKGELLSELGRLLRIDRYFTTPYHHEGNGVCERVFATFQEMLRTYINANQLDWDLFLPACTFAYNTTIHSSTNESPFFLVFGRDPVLNIDLLIKHQTQRHVPLDDDAAFYKEALISALHSAWTAAAEYNRKKSQAMKKQYDKGGLAPLAIQVGDRVFLRDLAPKPGLSHKLCFPWLGQFRVIAVNPPHLTIVSITAPQSKPRQVHMNQVKKCFTLAGPVFTSPWHPAAEQAALENIEATPVELVGYCHKIASPVTVNMADNDSTPVVDVKPASTATTTHPATPLQADAQSFDTLIKQDPDTILPAGVPLTPATHSGLPAPTPIHGIALTDDAPISSTAPTAPYPGEARPQSSRTAVHSTDTGKPDDAPSSSRSHSQGASSSFTAFRSPATPSGSQPAADNEPLLRPAKRERRAPPPRCNILPQPAHPPQLDHTPDNYWNHLMPHHPWACYITPLPEWTDLSNDNVTSALPKNRPVDVWVEHSSTVGRTVIRQTRFSFTSRALDVQLQTTITCHRSIQRAVERHSRINGNRRVVNICVKLARAPTGTDPVYELLSNEELFSELSATRSCRANDVLNTVYGNARYAPQRRQVPYPPLPRSVVLGSNTFRLRPDQVNALEMGSEDHPVLAIQAAYGTGKTVVGALLAARMANPGHIVVATATTNTAVAQFTDTLLKLSEFRRLHILRFVSDSALADGAPTTDVDLHVILKGLSTNYSGQLKPGEQSLCDTYTRGRELIETMIFRPDRTLALTDEERDEYRIAEQEISEATEEAVAIMFRVRRPSVVCMTTASLLNATSRSGIFKAHMLACHIIIGDEASQIPEPAFVAMAARFPYARHVYIGDINQLEPHVRCPRSSRAALFGAKGVMELLVRKGVPLAPLTTTFRMHPELNDLPNRLFYEGSLVSGTDAADRRLLLESCRTPNPCVPFVFVDTVGTSHRSPSGSHFNEGEAQTCRDIVQALTAREVPASSIAVITFYKDQFRCMEQYATQQGIGLYTVDSVQGREADIVILLTTRTDIEPASGKFLDDKLRLNVAITRCRHGQFVLGCVDALEKLPVWGRLLQWARERDVIVTTATLPDLFD